MFARLICRFFGHQWKPLTPAEIELIYFNEAKVCGARCSRCRKKA